MPTRIGAARRARRGGPGGGRRRRPGPGRAPVAAITAEQPGAGADGGQAEAADPAGQGRAAGPAAGRQGRRRGLRQRAGIDRRRRDRRLRHGDGAEGRGRQRGRAIGEQGLQVAPHRVGVGVAVGRVLGHGAGDDLGDALGQFGDVEPGVGRGLVAVREHDLGDRGRFGVGALGGQQAVVGGAQRIEVAPGVERLGLALLGAHVGRRADDPAGLGQMAGAGGVGELGEAEVRDLDRPVGVAEQVRRLDVAVDQSGPVRRRQPSAGLDDRLGRRPPGDRAGLHQVGQAAAGDLLHHEVVHRLDAADLEDRDHVRMRQPGRRPRLQEEALERRRVARQVVGQRLDGHRAAEQGVLGLVDDAHAAPAEGAVIRWWPSIVPAGNSTVAAAADGPATVASHEPEVRAAGPATVRSSGSEFGSVTAGLGRWSLGDGRSRLPIGSAAHDYHQS